MTVKYQRLKASELLFISTEKETQIMTTVTVRFENKNIASQSHENVARLIGFVSARNLIPLFDIEDLEANPRIARVGDVTDSIMDSIKSAPATFPFRTKGVLLGTTSYEALDRDRYRLHFESPDFEGILDGGHNMLAIGLHILENIPDVDHRELKRAKDWPAFKALWFENRDRVLSVATHGSPAESDFLNFVVPVEIVVPRDMTNESVVSAFRAALKDICDARNHNVELRDEALANRAGLYDALRKALDPELESRIEWKQNEGGDIKAREIIAMSMIPLNLIKLPSDESGEIKPIAVTAPYNSKASCVTQFNRIMSSAAVSSDNADGTRKVVTDPQVLSAFKILADIPAVYDEIYKRFPEAFNSTGARFGTIPQVKSAAELRTPPTTKYLGKTVDYQYPDGFIFPIVMGISELIGFADGVLYWKTEPVSFFKRHINAITEEFKPVIEDQERNPNKVGKSMVGYTVVRQRIKLQLWEEATNNG